MSRPFKASAVLVIVFMAALGLLLTDASQPSSTETKDRGTPGSGLVRDDSHVVGPEGSSDVVLVEFLDFECEACRAAYPVVEDLREKYAGRVTFVHRYFPMPGHFNAERAARAVESAARQGKYEQMYHRMFETQTEWGERREPADDVFRDFAEDLGLDLTRFDRDYASNEVLDRVKLDFNDGLAAGVQGTPTFFLNGKLVEPTSVADFEAAIEQALAEGT